MYSWDNPATWAILLVDDEIDNLEVVAETLEFYGVQVKTASNGLTALNLLETFSPTLVVTDLSMPGIDGWQLRGKIKRLPDKENMPVVALSAHAMAGDKERALSAGFDGYMTKPINVPSLIEDLKAALHEQASKKAVLGSTNTLPTNFSGDSALPAEPLSTLSVELPGRTGLPVESFAMAASSTESRSTLPNETPGVTGSPTNLDTPKLSVASPGISTPPPAEELKNADQEKSLI